MFNLKGVHLLIEKQASDDIERAETVELILAETASIAAYADKIEEAGHDFSHLYNS